MKKGFVHTENYRRLAEAQKLVAKRGAREAGLIIVQGKYGVGKSAMLARWAADNQAIFLRCKSTWTRRALLDVLADALGLDKRGRNQEVQDRIVGRLAIDMSPLMFDEADFLIGSTATLLEVIRDITDTTGVICFLVGMEFFGSKVARFGHIASRVAKQVEMLPITLQDATAACTQMCEVPLDQKVIEEVHAQCKGRMRHVLNAIATLEQWADANGWKRVEIEHVRNKALITEFTGKPQARSQGGAQ